MATLVTAPTASTATPRVRSNRAVIGATSTYIYRTSGGAIATATALPLPAGGVLLKVVTT